MINRKLRKCVLAGLGITVMAGISTQASAFSVTDLGTFTGTTISRNDTAPYKAFSDYSAFDGNLGWIHTADFFKLQVGTTPGDGSSYNVQIKMSGRGTLGTGAPNAMDNPAFALFAAGTNTITGNNTSGGHEWSPVRGPNTPGTDVNGNTTNVFMNDGLLSGGILDGSDGWVGYVQSATTGSNTYQLRNVYGFTGVPKTANGVDVFDTVSRYGVNGSTPWLIGGGSGSATNNNTNGSTGIADEATLTLYGLKAGNYLIAAAGACPIGISCGLGQAYALEIKAVPVPAAVWLFGSALAGFGAFGRRKGKALEA